MSGENNSTEWKLEEFAIQQCVAADTLPDGLALRHHDDASPAPPRRIFFEAVMGEQDPAFQGTPGVAVYTFALTAEYRTTDRDATVTDPIFAALLTALTNPKSNVAANAYFAGGLWFEQENSTDARTDGTNTRNRSRTYEFRVGQTA